MGGVCCKPKSEQTEVYITKQDVTLWMCKDDKGSESFTLKKNTKVFVLDNYTKWWQVQTENFVGFAAAYYFARNDAEKDYEKEPWYFGDVARADIEGMMKNDMNPDGSYIIRYSTKVAKFVLDLKLFDVNQGDFIYKHFDVKEGDGNS